MPIEFLLYDAKQSDLQKPNRYYCHQHTDSPTARAQNNASPLSGFFHRTNNVFYFFIPKHSYATVLSCFLEAMLLQAKLLHFV